MVHTREDLGHYRHLSAVLEIPVEDAITFVSDVATDFSDAHLNMTINTIHVYEARSLGPNILQAREGSSREVGLAVATNALVSLGTEENSSEVNYRAPSGLPKTLHIAGDMQMTLSSQPLTHDEKLLEDLLDVPTELRPDRITLHENRDRKAFRGLLGLRVVEVKAPVVVTTKK